MYFAKVQHFFQKYKLQNIIIIKLAQSLTNN